MTEEQLRKFYAEAQTSMDFWRVKREMANEKITTRLLEINMLKQRAYAKGITL